MGGFFRNRNNAVAGNVLTYNYLVSIRFCIISPKLPFRIDLPPKNSADCKGGLRAVGSAR